VRKGEELKFLLNGVVLYEKPDKLRILAITLWDGCVRCPLPGWRVPAFQPLQNRAYTGEVSEFSDLIAKANIKISVEKPEGSNVPNRIRIEMPKRRLGRT